MGTTGVGDEFAAACGAAGPVDLRVERADGLVLAEGRLDQPCGVVGRDANCDVVLTDPAVSPRHALLQVVGGRVLVADLGSRTGVAGAAGGPGFAWLTPMAATRIGPFHLFLRVPVSVAPTPLDRLPDPFAPHTPLARRLPRAVVRFRNGQAARREWAVSRLVALVGRSAGCKIRLAADEVADYHAYFLLTPAGLWVVDLLSDGGTLVNGQPVRAARLRPADDLAVGRFRMGCDYPDGEPVFPPVDPPSGFRLAPGPGSSPDLPPHPDDPPFRTPPAARAAG